MINLKDYTFMDLCCGIGGFHQALTYFGARCLFACDVDDKCRENYELNYKIKPFGDIKKINIEDIPYCDIVCAGFPCQPFSHSGYQLGFEDNDRGTIFFDIMRIIKNKKPKYILLENVSNLVSHDNGNTWNVIYNELLNCGYNTLKEPPIFNPICLGIPQNRDRVFIMCIRKDLGEIPEFYYEYPKKITTNIYSILQEEQNIDDKYRLNSDEIDLINLWDFFLQNSNKKYIPLFILSQYFNNDSIEEEIRTFPSWKVKPAIQSKEYYKKNSEFLDKWIKKSKNAKLYKNSKRQFEWQLGRDSNLTIWDSLLQFRNTGLRAKNPNYYPALVAMSNIPIIAKLKRYLTPRECARLQSFPDSYKLCPNDNIAYKQLGNSINIECLKVFIQFLFGDKEIREKYSIKNKKVLNNISIIKGLIVKTKNNFVGKIVKYLSNDNIYLESLDNNEVIVVKKEDIIENLYL